LKIDPLNDSPLTIMGAIINKVPIKDPAGTFQYTITEDSKSCL